MDPEKEEKKDKTLNEVIDEQISNAEVPKFGSQDELTEYVISLSRRIEKLEKWFGIK